MKELITVSHKIKVYVLHEEDEDICLVQFLIGVLAACCRKRGARFRQFLFTADSLANVHDYDERGFGHDSHEKALLLGVEILREPATNRKVNYQ